MTREPRQSPERPRQLNPLKRMMEMTDEQRAESMRRAIEAEDEHAAWLRGLQSRDSEG